MVTGAGSYSLAYASTDKAGNKESTVTVPFSIVGETPATEYIPIEGANRYETAVAAAKLAFPDGADTVVIATGANWPDALGGAALAGLEGAPILLTDPKTLPSVVRAEIIDLGATKAYILGSEAAVSAGVASAIDAIDGMAEPIRLAGSNRYATANEIAKKVKTLAPYDGVMFVATGANFPDALAASPIAAANGWPLYLAPTSGLLPQATLDIMKSGGTRVIILGSSAAVSDPVETQLNVAFPGSVLRLEGPNRYATGLAVVDYAVASAGLNWHAPAVATGTNFPDALAGGVLQGLDGSILLLTDGTKLTPIVGAAITANKDSILEVRYLGSTAAVSPAVRTAVHNIVQ
jgi:putative cell wall-binding protein